MQLHGGAKRDLVGRHRQSSSDHQETSGKPDHCVNGDRPGKSQPGNPGSARQKADAHDRQRTVAFTRAADNRHQDGLKDQRHAENGQNCGFAERRCGGNRSLQGGEGIEHQPVGQYLADAQRMDGHAGLEG